jgi:hypothetical protein
MEIVDVPDGQISTQYCIEFKAKKSFMVALDSQAEKDAWMIVLREQIGISL